MHEWQMSLCFALALAAVLGPMMVLFGLKFGIVGGMVQELVEDPRNREIMPIGSGRFSRAWLESVRQRDDVSFLVPRTRSIAASIQLKSQHTPRILPVEVIPSDRDDPLLGIGQPYPDGLRRIVLSQTVAEKLQVEVGDQLDGSLSRRFGGQKERVHLTLTLAGIASASAFARDAMFADLRLIEALEDFRDGRAVSVFDWQGDPPPPYRTYPGFRLYAQSIYDVAILKGLFADKGVDTRTRAADIELVQRMDKNLSAIFWAIAIIGLIGFSLSLGASLWANVDRKRKELSVLRLVGFRTGDIVWFPVIQAMYTALIGWAMAAGIYEVASWSINDMLATQMQGGQAVCLLLPVHFAWALALTVGSAVLAAALAGMRSARVEPSEGLREI